MTNLQKQLFALQDKDYREFHSRLMPTVDKADIIGIRTPVLRKFAKEYIKTNEYLCFLKALPHKFYEENNLHAFILSEMKDFSFVLSETDRFLPYINNWATCDCFRPKAFKKAVSSEEKRNILLNKIFVWIESGKTYTVRYAIGILMDLFLDDYFKPEYMRKVAEISSDEYYIQMMQAWYFATALFKQCESALPYISEKKLGYAVAKKAVQKAAESYRIPADMKLFLKNVIKSGYADKK